MNDFEDLVRTIVTLVDQEEQDKLREMEDWIVKNEGTWVLSEGFNVFLGNSGFINIQNYHMIFFFAPYKYNICKENKT